MTKGLVGIFMFLCFSSCYSNKPNIIFIIADDLGWNDVGFHGSNEIPTPNIDALAYSGIILNRYYTMPVCTPSRSALMTGKHPIHTGMQHKVIFATEPWGLSLKEKILPEYLKELGYNTSLVGKWHLGHYKKQYTPLYRGFDTHFGFWSGRIDYYTHTAEERPRYWGHDFRRGENVSRDTYGKYTTHLLTDEALNIIDNHNKTRPLFLYLAHLAVHSGNKHLPLQAPRETVEKFMYITNKKRRIYAAMLHELDVSIGKVVAKLSEHNMLENSIIVFTTDNGGASGGFNNNAASNWPLRGTKDGMWEGGIRGSACIWSPLIHDTSRVMNKNMHIQDWLPTFLNMLNVNFTNEDFDGRNIWPALQDSNISTYDEQLYVIDNTRGLSAIRQGKWKLFTGTVYQGYYDYVIGPDGRYGRDYDIDLILNSDVTKAINLTSKPLPDINTILILRELATVKCEKQPIKEEECHPIKGEICLFDIERDPCESYNLANRVPFIKDRLLRKLSQYNSSLIQQRNKPTDPASNPKYWGYNWVNWMDYDMPPPLRQPLYTDY